MFNYSTPSLADIAAVTGNNGNNGFGGENGWWIIVILAILFGWGNGGYGFGGNGSMGAADNYVLASDFANVSRQISDTYASTERKLDSITNGICDLGYTALANSNTTNQLISENGYQSRLATQTLGSQLASCCCDIKQAIGETNYNIATQANAINTGIERGFANVNYNMATQNCATLSAIDKVGDRIIDYMSSKELATLRDENQALRLAASQERQNNYLVEQLRPCPQPCYITCNPFASAQNYGYNSCGCGCN